MSHELIYHVTLFAGMEANLACPVKLSLILFNRGLPSSIPKDSAAYLTGVNNVPKDHTSFPGANFHKPDCREK